MSTPDPKTVREIATEIILDCGRNADDVGAYVRIRVGDDLSKHEHEAWCSAIRSAIRTAVVTVEWPGKQQPADVVTAEVKCGRECSEMHTYERGSCEAAVTAEQQQDGATRRVEAIRARYDTHGFRALSDGQIDELFGFLLGQLANLSAVTARAESAEGAWSAQQDIIEAERMRAEREEAERTALAARVAELESELDAAARIAAVYMHNRLGMGAAASELRALFADRIAALDATETEES